MGSDAVALSCPGCGAEVRVGMLRCRDCGRSLASDAPPEPAAAPRPRVSVRNFSESSTKPTPKALAAAEGAATGAAHAGPVPLERMALGEAIKAAKAAAPVPTRRAPDEKPASLPPKTLQALRKTLAGAGLDAAEVSERVRAVEKLATALDSAAIDLLVDSLDDPAGAVRTAVLTALSRGRSPAIVNRLLSALDNDSVEMRRAAALALGEGGDRRAAVPLLMLAAGDPLVRPAVSEAIARMGDGAVPVLNSAARSGDAEVRLAAAAALTRMQSAAGAPTLGRLLQDADPRVRAQAFEGASRLESPAVVKVLVAGCRDPDPAVRLQAASGLARRADPSSVPALLPLLHDSRSDVRAKAAAALGALEAKPAVPELARLLNDTDPEVRLHAAEALGRIGDPAAVGALLGCVYDSRSAVRQGVAGALGRMKHPDAVPGLIKLLRDPDEPVRVRSMDALGELGDPRAVELLAEELLTGRTAELRTAAARALGRIKDIRALQPLKDALRDEFTVRSRSVIALGQLGSARALPALFAMLSDEAAEIRFHAAVALGQIGDVDAREPLERQLEIETDATARRGIARALRQLGDTRSEQEILDVKPKPPRARRAVARLAPTFLFHLTGWAAPLAERFPGGRSALLAVLAAGILVAAVGIGFLVRAMFHVPPLRIGATGALAFAADGNSLLRGGTADGMQRTRIGSTLWEEEWPAHQGGTTCLAVSADGSRVASGGNDRRVRVASPAGELLWEIPGDNVHKGAILALQFHRDGTQLAVASRDGIVSRWDAAHGKPLGTAIQVPARLMNVVSFSPHLDAVAVGAPDGSVYYLALDDGRPLWTESLGSAVTAVAVDSSGEFVAAGSDKGRLWLRGTAASASGKTLGNHAFAVAALAFAGENRLVSAGRDNVVLVWSLSEMTSRALESPLEAVDVMAASPDGARVAAGAVEDPFVVVWNVATGKVETAIRPR